MHTWMPGYYQKMDYTGDVLHMVAEDEHGTGIPLNKVNNHVDSLHAYIIPENTFLFVEGHITTPVFVQIENNPAWNNTVTGSEPVQGPSNVYIAPHFDVLYDSPILLGDLEELPSFSVRGIEHRFVGYNMGAFDETGFINTLKTVVESAVNIIGDIPFRQYTFIAIGPGRGGIEHLNNTTISFRGGQLDSEQYINTVENNPGRVYPSLVQASYQTWEDGPFGNQGENRGKTISYYEKEPVVWLLPDFAIRHATQNEMSLDNVMQFLYWEYYKKKQRDSRMPCFNRPVKQLPVNH